MSNLNAMQKACLEATRKVDAAVLRLNRRQYEDDMQQVAYWRAVALDRSNRGLSLMIPSRRIKYFLAQAAKQRQIIAEQVSQL
jgi:hypothetical protein